jgi:hypothetical protein
MGPPRRGRWPPHLLRARRRPVAREIGWRPPRFGRALPPRRAPARRPAAGRPRRGRGPRPWAWNQFRFTLAFRRRRRAPLARPPLPHRLSFLGAPNLGGPPFLRCGDCLGPKPAPMRQAPRRGRAPRAAPCSRLAARPSVSYPIPGTILHARRAPIPRCLMNLPPRPGARGRRPVLRARPARPRQAGPPPCRRKGPRPAPAC